jgi:hypothetical protein
MVFVDGEQSEVVCPKCHSLMTYEMSFLDKFNPISGHYTVDVPIIVCESCDYYVECDEI